ncbi:MAG: TolC family protein [Bacteroidota bacterium]|nr:TolC family protein [Bacteroidota bacterium]
MKFLFSLFVLFEISAAVHAQKAFTYRQCVKYALEHNLGLQNNRFDADKQNINLQAARLSFLPRINASTSYEINRGKTVNAATNTYVESNLFSNDWALVGSMLIFDGFRQTNRVAFEQFNLNVTNLQYEQAKNELIYGVLEAYTTHLLNVGLITIQQQQYDLSKKECDKVDKMVEMGRLPGSDRYEVQARLANDEYLLLRYRNATQQSEYTLRKLMNFPVDSAIQFADLSKEPIISALVSDDSLFRIAADKLPQIKILNNQYHAARKSLQMERGSLTPKLRLYGGWYSGYYQSVVDANGKVVGFSDQIDRNHKLNYGLALDIPILGALSRQNNVRMSKISYKQAQNRLEAGMQALQYEVRQARQDRDAAVKEYQSALKKEESEKVAFESSQKKHEKGLMNIMDYYESKNNLARAGSEVLRTRMQMYVKEICLNFYKTGSMIDWQVTN